MRTLIVDDDPILRRILQATLTRLGHEVVPVDDGHAAWRAMQEAPFRMVLTDWMMPGMDGTELARRIRAAGFAGYTYIILLTARAQKEDVVLGLESGADDYLVKPFDLAELRARVKIGERILDLEARLSEARDQMQILAQCDALTGLFNRRCIQEHAESDLRRAQRERASLGFVMLDIDHFKQVNDRYGHQVGDEALRLVATTLNGAKRATDHVGRWGGEEFLLIVHASPADAVRAAERLRARVAAIPLVLPDGAALELRVSMGVTTAGADTYPPLDDLLRQADEALYTAKRAGRNQVQVFATAAPPGETTSERGVDAMRRAG